MSAVNHPSHYNQTGVECIDLIEALPCNPANAIKYLWRYQSKGKPAEDLQKALWYLERELSRLGIAGSCRAIEPMLSDVDLAAALGHLPERAAFAVQQILETYHGAYPSKYLLPAIDAINAELKHVDTH